MGIPSYYSLRMDKGTFDPSRLRTTPMHVPPFHIILGEGRAEEVHPAESSIHQRVFTSLPSLLVALSVRVGSPT